MRFLEKFQLFLKKFEFLAVFMKKSWFLWKCCKNHKNENFMFLFLWKNQKKSKKSQKIEKNHEKIEKKSKKIEKIEKNRLFWTPKKHEKTPIFRHPRVPPWLSGFSNGVSHTNFRGFLWGPPGFFPFQRPENRKNRLFFEKITKKTIIFVKNS